MHTHKVAEVVAAVSAQAARIGAVKEDAEADLAAAKPALDEALAALNQIEPKHIQRWVCVVCVCVECVVFGVRAAAGVLRATRRQQPSLPQHTHTTTKNTQTRSLKALKSPPDIIKRIFDCVLLLRMAPVERVAWWDVKGAMVIAGSYGEAIKMMADSAFLARLVK